MQLLFLKFNIPTLASEVKHQINVVSFNINAPSAWTSLSVAFRSRSVVSSGVASSLDPSLSRSVLNTSEILPLCEVIQNYVVLGDKHQLKNWKLTKNLFLSLTASLPVFLGLETGSWNTITSGSFLAMLLSGKDRRSA